MKNIKKIYFSACQHHVDVCTHIQQWVTCFGVCVYAEDIRYRKGVRI
jgi:hypothetical protein